MHRLEEFLHFAYGSPIALVYLFLAGGAAVENFFPPIPSDTFILVGGVLADRGVLSPALVLGLAWFSNVTGALFVYAMARQYGRGIFRTRWGHWLLRPHQLERLGTFYSRYGLVAIFGSRFLPVLRVVVPAFAGITGLGFWSTALPVALASAVWYTMVVFAGILASRNLSRLLGLFEAVNTWLLVVAGALAVGVAIWWWRTRRHRHAVGEARDDRAEEEARRWAPEGEAVKEEAPRRDLG